MSSEHASHKGDSVKSVTTVSAQGDPNQDDIPTETGYPFNAGNEVDVNPAAVERSQKPVDQK